MNSRQFRRILLVLLLISLDGLLVDGRKSIGSSRRGGSSNARSYRVVPTSKTHVNTQQSSYNTHGSNSYSGNNYNTQRKAVNVGTTPRYIMHTQAPVKYHPPATQATPRNYPQVTPKKVYQQQAVYTPKPSYTQKPVYPQQSSYPKQPHPQQNYPSLSQPTHRPYGGSYSGGNNYNNYNPGYGGYYKKKDHTVRNTVLAGLGGSALGMYLGYKLGGLTNSMNNPYGGAYGGYGGYSGGVGGGAGGGMPPYSVVHHYHHGDKPIIQNAVVEQNVITPCSDVQMCMPNTTPLCMTNGTIFCVTPIGQTSTCTANSTDLPCITANITAPCLNATDEACNNTQLTTQNLEIPCVSSIDVYGDFATNKLSVQSAGGVNSNGQDSLTNQGISNKYCVTVIAEPLIEPKNLSNAEYVKYLQENPYANAEADAKVGSLMNTVGAFMLG